MLSILGCYNIDQWQISNFQIDVPHKKRNLLGTLLGWIVPAGLWLRTVLFRFSILGCYYIDQSQISNFQIDEPHKKRNPILICQIRLAKYYFTQHKS